MLVRISVRDTGIGIPPQAIEHIFDAFEQADGTTTRRYGGTGLGLAISRQLVELMGGKIGVKSEAGKGSEFWFTALFRKAAGEDLKSTDLSQRTSIESTPPRPPTQLDDAHILLAEDNPVNQVVAQEMLDRLGYRTTTVTNGVDTLKAVEEENFDLILMDCEMPKLDGFESTKAIRQTERANGGQHIPIIALTAHAMNEDRQKALDSGMDDFLSKPFGLEELRDIIRKNLTPQTSQSSVPAI